MAFVKLNDFCFGFRTEQLVYRHALLEGILLSLQMYRWKVELRCQPLCILLILVAEPHLLIDWRGYRHHELRHLESLSTISSPWHYKRLRVYLLSDSDEMSEDDATL